jgi:hypothetical protein
MTIEFNDIFKNLLAEYELPEDLSFEFEIPEDVQEILDDSIIVSPYGVSLKSRNKQYNESYENIHYDEDLDNHFHVDWSIDPPDAKKAFMLGIGTLILLAEKFEKERITGVRLWYSFQTPEMGEQWEKANGLYEEGSESFISDRLSFHTRRDNGPVMELNKDGQGYWAILVVDI